MSDQVPDLAIILLNWNGLDYTLACLKSLKSATYRDFQVVVVDNGSSSEEVEKLKTLSEIHLIALPENTGFTGGNNVGIAWALKQQFKYIMLLNNDTEVDSGFIGPLMAPLLKGEVGATQPKIYNLQDKNLIWGMGGYINKWSGKPITIAGYVPDDGAYTGTRQVDWISGCCILASSEIFQQVGDLDHKFFALCEDVDWSLRVRKAGYSLQVVSDSVIYHAESASTTSKIKSKEGYRSPFRVFLNIRNHIYLLRKHPDQYFIPTAVLSQLFKLITYAAYFLIRRRWQKLTAVRKGFWEGIRM